MSREFKGKIVHIGTETSGKTKSKNEDWKAIEFVAEETEGEFKEKVVFSFFAMGDKLKNVENFVKYAKIGALVEVKFSIKTNEYNGKFYSKNEAFSVFLTKEETASKPSEQPTIKTDNEVIDINSDDLPF